MARADRGSLSAEEGEIPGPSQRLTQTKLKSKVLAYGGGVQRLCKAVPQPGLHCTQHFRRRAISNSTEVAEKASRWLWINGSVGVYCYGLINLSWVA